MEETIEKIKQLVKDEMNKDASGHDYWHVIRVYTNALLLIKKVEGEGISVDKDLVQIASLLHDIGDYKITGDQNTQTERPREILQSLGLNQELIDKAVTIIGEISYHDQVDKLCCIESEIVQDADRLDALGAIGIARTFAFGGAKKRTIYDPNERPKLHMTKEEYVNNKGNSINHFYEKLLLLKEMFNTSAGKKIAENRHHFMEQFLEQFFAEWNGER